VSDTWNGYSLSTAYMSMGSLDTGRAFDFSQGYYTHASKRRRVPKNGYNL